MLKTAKCYKIFRKSDFLLISRAYVMTSSLSLLYFHKLHRNLKPDRTNNQTQTTGLWFPRVSCYPPSYARIYRIRFMIYGKFSKHVFSSLGKTYRHFSSSLWEMFHG